MDDLKEPEPIAAYLRRKAKWVEPEFDIVEQHRLIEAADRIEALEAEVKEAAAAERARVVAWLRKENGRCDCHAHSEVECACGAWDEYKTKSLLEIADAIEAGNV